jgi:hypothetical protein
MVFRKITKALAGGTRETNQDQFQLFSCLPTALGCHFWEAETLDVAVFGQLSRQAMYHS